MKGQKTAKFFVVATVFVLAVAFLSSTVMASIKPDIQEGEVINYMRITSGNYESPIFKADFEFNLIGLAWQGEAGNFFVRYNTDEGWGEWYYLDEFVGKDGWNFSQDPVLVNGGREFQYKIESPTNIKTVKIIYLGEKVNKLPNWNIFNFISSAAQAANELEVIPRADWQADENWRFNASEEEIWPTEYQWPEKVVIHHTAGDDGSDNPKATLRGVYYWHAVVLGWGDIGYNYVIDQEGNIYEGRYGGDGVVGAHVYRSKTCARERFGDEQLEADFNKGTIGIAILGDYQSKITLNEKVKDSLTTLIAHRAKNFEIRPTGESYLIDDTYPNIVGHKDLDCTDCPGKNLYSQLETIRTQAQTKYESIGGIINPVVKATYVDQIEQPIEINAGEEKEVWVEFQNDGNVTWRSYEQQTLSVLARSASSDFYVAGWNSATEAAQLTTPNVAPGEVGRFVFTVKAPTDQLEVTEQFELSFGDQTLNNTTFTVTAQITGFEYAALLDNQSILPATFVKSPQTITLQFKNRGLQTWHQGEVKLNVYDLGHEVSRFYDDSWPDEYGQIDFLEDEVNINKLATFTFKFKSPTEPGLYKNIYRLVGDYELVQNEDYSISRVDSTYQAELTAHNIPPAVLNVWRLPAIVKFKNVGLSTWDRNTVLKIYDLGNEISRFKDDSWVDNYIAVKLSEWSVKPGEVGTFSFRFRSPTEPGLYHNRFELVRNGSVVQGSEFSLVTRVDN